MNANQLYFLVVMFFWAYSWYSIQPSVGILDVFKAQGLISWYCIYIQASSQSSHISAQFEYLMLFNLLAALWENHICLFVACTDDMPIEALYS